MTESVPQLLCPVCPWCGHPPAFLVSQSQAVCATDDCPAFMWNPTKPAATNIASSSQLVEEEDDEGRLMVRPVPLPLLDPCHCGRPARGMVPGDDVIAGAHLCRQCSPDHCTLRAFMLDEGRPTST